MIKTSERTPSVLSRESRDYQVIGHLFDAAFNANKLAASTIINNAPNSLLDYRFVNLACKTIGFFCNKSYTADELLKVISSFKYIVANKGKRQGIEDAIKLFLNAKGITDDYYIPEASWVNNKDKELIIYLPAEVNDTSLLEEIFDYILPAGWIYSIISKNIISASLSNNSTELGTKDSIRVKGGIKDNELSKIDYLDEDTLKDYSDIGQVPHDGIDLLTPVVGEDVVISTAEQLKEGK